MRTSVLLLAACLGALCGVSQAIECYMCNTFSDTNCKDDFVPATAKPFIKTCNETQYGPNPFCLKVKMSIWASNEVRVHRDCASSDKRKEIAEGRSCYQKRSDDYVADYCQCEGDMCNSAGSLGVALSALLLPALAGYL